MNTIFKIIICLLINTFMILVIFHSLFVIRNFRDTSSSIEMLKGYIARRNFDNTCPKPKPSPVATGSFGGLIPPKKL